MAASTSCLTAPASPWRSAGTAGPMLDSARHARSASGHSRVEIRCPRSTTSKPAGLEHRPRRHPGRLMLLSRFIDAKCGSRRVTGEGLEARRAGRAAGPLPQKLMPIPPPGRSTRYASSSAASHPPQIPLIDTTASKASSSHGSSNIEPDAHVGVRGARRGRSSTSAAGGVDARRPSRPSPRRGGWRGPTAGDVEQRRVPGPTPRRSKIAGDDVEGVVLVETGPVVGSVAPRLARLPPVVPVGLLGRCVRASPWPSIVDARPAPES